MSKKSMIGLDAAKSKELAEELNNLLANYQIFYINTRGFHWNIKGEKFFELHIKFEELYNNSILKIDEIAERIVTLGYTPLHSYTDYVNTSTIPEIKDVSDGKQAIEKIVEGFQVLLDIERDILGLSEEANDEGTNSMMSDYIREQEKLVWMYSSYLGQ